MADDYSAATGSSSLNSLNSVDLTDQSDHSFLMKKIKDHYFQIVGNKRRMKSKYDNEIDRMNAEVHLKYYIIHSLMSIKIVRCMYSDHNPSRGHNIRMNRTMS